MSDEIQHRTEVERCHGDGGLDDRVDREYRWTCTCGAEGEPTSRRAAATEQRDIHERENRP